MTKYKTDSRVRRMGKMRNSYKYLFGNLTVNVSHWKFVVIKSTYWNMMDPNWQTRRSRLCGWYMFVGTHIQRHKDKTTAIALRNCQSRPENQYQQNKRNTHPHPNKQPLLLNDQKIEQVSEFPYLSSIISKDNGGTDRDMAERIKRARGVFGTLNTIWRPTTYSNNTEIRIFNTDVKSVLFYGCEIWKPIYASAEYWKYSGWSRYQNKNCWREPSKGQLN